MSEWQGYDLDEFPELSDPEATIKEALRDTIGDGEGIDGAVIDRFKANVQAEALRELADEFWSVHLNDKQRGFVKTFIVRRAARIEEGDDER